MEPNSLQIYVYLELVRYSFYQGLFSHILLFGGWEDLLVLVFVLCVCVVEVFCFFFFSILCLV